MSDQVQFNLDPLMEPLDEEQQLNQQYTFPPPESLQYDPNQEQQQQQLASGGIDWASLLFAAAPQAPIQSGCSEGDNNCGGTTTEKGKGGGRGKKPRFAFQTRSANDILDDGYRWRKYGQKAVKNSNHPRSYYRCTHHTCNVKKQIQRLSKDTSMVVTTYEGIHNHPCEKLMEALTPLLNQIQFLSRF